MDIAISLRHQSRTGCVDVRELPLRPALAANAQLPVHRSGIAASWFYKRLVVNIFVIQHRAVDRVFGRPNLYAMDVAQTRNGRMGFPPMTSIYSFRQQHAYAWPENGRFE